MVFPKQTKLYCDVFHQINFFTYSIPKQRVSICSKIYMYIYNIIIQLKIFKILHFSTFPNLL